MFEWSLIVKGTVNVDLKGQNDFSSFLVTTRVNFLEWKFVLENEGHLSE